MAEQAARADQRELVLTEGFIWALASLCRLHRIPFDADLVVKQFPPPYDLATLLRAAEACGLKAGLAGAKGDALATLPLPCVGFVRAAQAANEPRRDGAASPTLALLVRADQERVLYFLAGEEAPRRRARGGGGLVLVVYLCVSRCVRAGRAAAPRGRPPPRLPRRREKRFRLPL